MEEIFAKRLEKAMLMRNIKASELSEKAEIPKSAISQYLSGLYEAKQKSIFKLANVLDVSEAWLMGLDVPMEKNTKIDNLGNPVISIPILGTVKAGYNWLAEENVIGYITDNDTIKDYQTNLNEYFALKITGDSMLPLLSDGDLVIVHDQDDVESGQTAVILINGEEATVKKIIKTNEGIELHAMNPYYPVKKFTFEDMQNIPIKIIGRVKEAKIKGAFK